MVIFLVYSVPLASCHVFSLSKKKSSDDNAKTMQTLEVISVDISRSHCCPDQSRLLIVIW